MNLKKIRTPCLNSYKTGQETIILLSLAVLSMIISGCSENNSGNSNNVPLNVQTASEQTVNEQAAPVQNNNLNYQGAMTKGASTLPIRLTIGGFVNGEAINSSYLYTNYNEPILLSGGIRENQLVLFEDGAKFVFDNFNADNNNVTGKWTSFKDENNIYDVKLEAVRGTAAAAAPGGAASQTQFENVILQYSKEFDKANNELQESVCRGNRKNAIAALNMGYYIENWAGTIDTLGTNTEGKAYIRIRLSPNLNVTTWNNAVSDIFDNTLIEMNSELYQVLYNLNKGQRVRFSGYLFKADDDFYKETSVTIRGAMKDSEFLLRFTDIKPF